MTNEEAPSSESSPGSDLREIQGRLDAQERERLLAEVASLQAEIAAIDGQTLNALALSLFGSRLREVLQTLRNLERHEKLKAGDF